MDSDRVDSMIPQPLNEQIYFKNSDGYISYNAIKL